MKYYVDLETLEVVSEKDLDVTLLAPEIFCEYRCGAIEGVIFECWDVGNGQVLDFATRINNPYKAKERHMHFEKYGVHPLRIIAYTVPPSWYKEKTIET